ncbi:hypothetical protein KPH14_013059, partial [Odynerus spinipes]
GGATKPTEDVSLDGTVSTNHFDVNLVDNEIDRSSVDAVNNLSDLSSILRRQLQICLVNNTTAISSSFARKCSSTYTTGDITAAAPMSSSATATTSTTVPSTTRNSKVDNQRSRNQSSSSPSVSSSWVSSYEECLLSLSRSSRKKGSSNGAGGRGSGNAGHGGATAIGTNSKRGGTTILDEILTDQNLRQFFSTVLYSQDFFTWLSIHETSTSAIPTSRVDSIFSLHNFVNINDRAFVKIFSLFLKVLRQIENFHLGVKDVDIASRLNEIKVVSWAVRKTRQRVDGPEFDFLPRDLVCEEYFEDFDFSLVDVLSPEELAKVRLHKVTRNFDIHTMLQFLTPRNSISQNLCQYIWLNSFDSLKRLRSFFPCSFVVSRGTINLANSFVDFVDSRTLDVDRHIANRRAAERARAQSLVDAVASNTFVNHNGDDIVASGAGGGVGGGGSRTTANADV